MSMCNPLWSSYYDSATPTQDPKAWANATTTYGHPSTVSTETTLVWTSFSTATTGIIVRNRSDALGHAITMTPIWVLGSPVPSTIVTTLPDDHDYYIILSGPTPKYSFVGVQTANPSLCGQCQIIGGTVDLYFWPPATATGRTNSSGTDQPQSTTLDGTTLIAPSVQQSTLRIGTRLWWYPHK